MRFPKVFYRYKGTAPTGGITLGTDAAPTTTPPVGQDNIFTHRTHNVNGWPCHRIAMVCSYVGAGTAPTTLPVTMYLWEDSTQAWHKIAAVKNLTLGQIAFFDTIGALDMSGISAEWANQMPGGEQIYVKVDDNSGADGQYIFALVADLTVAGA